MATDCTDSTAGYSTPEGTSTPQRITTTQYTPAPYLIEASPLTAEDLIHYYQDFYNSLEYISYAPPLVFERLVANVIGSKATISPRQPPAPDQEQDDKKYAAALEECRKENRALSLENDRLKAKLAGAQGEPSTETAAETRPNIGNFHTAEVLSCNESGKAVSKEIFFSGSYAAPPGIAVGMRWIYVKKGGVVRVATYATEIRKDGFRINHQNWCNSTVFSVGSSWLSVAPNDPDFQYGTFSTQENHPWVEARHLTTRRITFARPYDIPPQVVVWLSAFQMGTNTNWRVKTYTSDITTTGFTLHIDTWSDTILFTATASWVSCTANKPNVCMGAFKSSDRPISKENGYTKFKSGGFTAPPRVLLAINLIDMGCGKDMRIKIGSPRTDINGVNWFIECWDNITLYEAGASFIALG